MSTKNIEWVLEEFINGTGYILIKALTLGKANTGIAKVYAGIVGLIFWLLVIIFSLYMN